MAIDPICVFLAEDHGLVRAGFRQLLESSDNIKVVGEAASAEEAFGLLKESLPQVLVLDDSLPGISGLDALGRFLQLLPGLQVLMLSVHESHRLPELALERGARGYLSKRYAAEELVLAVHQVATGQHYVSSDIAPR